MSFKNLIKSKYSFLILILGIGFIYFILWFSSSFFGWYGYEKWKYRRCTYGNRDESIERKVFIKDLGVISNIKLDSFNIYIERGFKYGYHSSEKTRFEINGSFPFQISFTDRTNSNNTVYYITQYKKSENDSIAETLYLKKPFIKDTLIIGIETCKVISEEPYEIEWDSIGYIKVFEK